MATSDSPLLVLNCGNTRVSAAVFLSDGAEQLHLESVVSRELEYDYNQEEGWLDALADAVKSMKKEGKLPPRGNYILPGNKFLTKQLQVPHVEPSKQRQIIAVEAQQSIPHLFGQVEWDSQVLHDDGIEADVLFLASKREDLQEFYDKMKGAGVAPLGIAASPVLDYNAFLHTYQDFGEDCMLLNIGARTSNLLFVSQDGLLVRSINLGGNVLTQNVAEQLGIPFEEAERKKVGYCMGSLYMEDDDPFVIALEQQREKYLKRLNQELTRSVVSYRNQRKQTPPQYLLVSGKGSLLYGLTEYIGETQNLEIHHLDPLGNVTVDESITEEELTLLYYELSESVGEAARHFFGERLEAVGVNLLPATIQKKVSAGKQMPWYVAASLLFCAAPVFPYLKISGEVSKYQDFVATKSSEVSNAKRWERSMAKHEKSCYVEYKKIKKLEGLVNSKYNWIIFFQDVEASLQRVKDVWLEDLKIERNENKSYVQSDDPDEPPTLVTQKVQKVKLSGRMLLRVGDGESGTGGTRGEITQDLIMQRIIQLKDGIEESEFVQPGATFVIEFKDFDQGLNILRFTFDLTINPGKPL